MGRAAGQRAPVARTTERRRANVVVAASVGAVVPTAGGGLYRYSFG